MPTPNPAVTDLDPQLYLRAPVLDVPSAVALGIALLTAADKKLPLPARKAAKRVRECVVELQSRWAEQRAAQAQDKPNPRPADLRLDRAWSALGRPLQFMQELPPALPQAQRAAKVYTRLFRDGFGFLALPFAKQWAESQQRIELIESAALGKDLADLVGQWVLDEVRAAHAEYGEVLGITDAKAPAASPVRIADALRDLQSAMSSYGLQLVAAAHADHELVGLVRKALRPIDDLRDAQARRAVSPSPTPEPTPDVTPTTSVPEVDDTVLA